MLEMDDDVIKSLPSSGQRSRDMNVSVQCLYIVSYLDDVEMTHALISFIN